MGWDSGTDGVKWRLGAWDLSPESIPTLLEGSWGTQLSALPVGFTHTHHSSEGTDGGRAGWVALCPWCQAGLCRARN